MKKFIHLLGLAILSLSMTISLTSCNPDNPARRSENVYAKKSSARKRTRRSSRERQQNTA